MKEITLTEGAKLGLMRVPNLAGLREVFAERDIAGAGIKKGQQGFRSSNGVRVFVPTDFSLGGERLYKCYDVEPDSPLWTAHPRPVMSKTEL